MENPKNWAKILWWPQFKECLTCPEDTKLATTGRLRYASVHPTIKSMTRREFFSCNSLVLNDWWICLRNTKMYVLSPALPIVIDTANETTRAYWLAHHTWSPMTFLTVALENKNLQERSSKQARLGTIVSQLRKLKFPLMMSITWNKICDGVKRAHT